MKLQRTIRLCAGVLAVSLPLIQAQAQGTGPIGPIGSRQVPIPAARGLDMEPSAIDSARPQADTHTLSSIERLGVGSLGVVRSFVDPSFRLNQSLDTGVVPGTKNSVTQVGMSFLFDRNISRSRLTGSYSGAHIFYHPNLGNDITYHNLFVSQEVRWARWLLRWRDDLLISPEAAFGGLLGSGNSQGGLPPATSGADTILTEHVKRVNNIAAGEINYLLSRRSTLTFVGAYSLLHFTSPSFIDSSGITARVGYDHALTPKDSIGLVSEYTRTVYSAANPLLQTAMVQLAYGRRVTGRLAFQMSAGPQMLQSGSQRIVDWNLRTATTYQTGRRGYSFSYTHGTATGSGVFSGTHSHTVVAGMNYTLTQSWDASVNGGYAFNSALTPTPGVDNSFGNWYGTANLGRSIGRHVHFGVNYGYQQQNAASVGCSVATCVSRPSRHIVGATIEWHPWSMVQR